MPEISKIITSTRAYSCLDCGKCTAACPVSKYDANFTPRKIVQDASWRCDELLKDGKLWKCITCSMCEEHCQSGVRYTELIKSLRAEAYTQGNKGQCTHGGALESLMHLMTSDKLKQDRLGWVDKKLKTATKSEVLYFTGCQPYFDVIFEDLGVKTNDIGRGAIKLLNKAGVIPALMPDERCCGHDLLWAGDVENFTKLAKLNLKAIAKTGAKKVVTTCPECYHTLKVEYPKYVDNIDFEVVHISQFLAEKVASGGLKFRQTKNKVTYLDPCRLGRISGIYEEPRELVKAIPELDFREMERNRNSALCCGTQAWINCGAVNKQIQAELLRDAKKTGADTLLTFCPKCQIHLKCALSDNKLKQELNIEIEDVTSFAAEALEGGEG